MSRRADRWLKSKINEDPNGWVDISVLLSFNRVQSLIKGSGAEGDAAKVALLARVLSTSKVVEVNDSKTRLKRVQPVPTSYNSKARTVYAKGFPEGSTLDSLSPAFAQFGTVKRLALRRYQGKFKGSVFVEFATEDEAKKCVDGLKEFDGKPLERVMMIAAYFSYKAEQRRAKR